MNNESLLASFERNRTAEEYEKVFYESKVVYQKLLEYDLEDSGIEEVPLALHSKKIWDAESAELWLLEPEKKKLISLDDVPACLCEQSQTTDTTAELVFVGPGTSDGNYEGKDVKDKIVLVTARFYEAHEKAVKFGAKGLIAYNSSNSDTDLGQVGRDTIVRSFDPTAPGIKMPTFGFMVSAQTGEQLRRILAEGTRVVVHAQCRTKYYPYRNEVVWALIKGSERPAEELLLAAHLFEEMAYQGANDNASGSVSILETARVINKLIGEGKIPRPKRSVRFLWVDEGAGTVGYLIKYPELLKRCFADINEDMVGESLVKNSGSFHFISTPYSRPSYLNDVVANFLEYVGETNRNNIIHRPVKFVRPIVSPTGTRDPFYCQIEKFYGGSDHTIFLDGGIGIPAVFLNGWPDIWYHTSEDRPDKSDSTQLKRVGFIVTASVIYLANASQQEAVQMIGEVLSWGPARIADEGKRAYGLLSKSAPVNLTDNYKEGRNIVYQSYQRESAPLRSISFFAPKDRILSGSLDEACRNLAAHKILSLSSFEDQYKRLAVLLNVQPVIPQLTSEEIRLSKIVPKRTEAMKGYFDRRAFANAINGKSAPEYHLMNNEDYEIRNFINDKSSILEIRNAVSAEFRPIPLSDVEDYIKALKIGGMVNF